ncbi:MAG: hypothetical protein EOO38_18265, partial [Cytophagaceae bacterium]
MSKLTQFQAYRLAQGADPAIPFSPALRDSILLETKHFSGVDLRCSYATGGGAISPGYTIEVWYYDRTRDKYFQDYNQTITVSEIGNRQHSINTDGQLVLFRIAAGDLLGP